MKARDRDRRESLAACEHLGAEACGLLVQRDTYFETPKGRLKLRQESGTAAQLISYVRPDQADGRESRYYIVEVEDAETMLEALSSTLGVKVVISKQRRLFLWNGVRIHLDDVELLGAFIEFEAIAAPGSDLSAERQRIARLREDFAIADADLLGGSYSDLMLASR